MFAELAAFFTALFTDAPLLNTAALVVIFLFLIILFNYWSYFPIANIILYLGFIFFIVVSVSYFLGNLFGIPCSLIVKRFWWAVGTATTFIIIYGGRIISLLVLKRKFKLIEKGVWCSNVLKRKMGLRKKIEAVKRKLADLDLTADISKERRKNLNESLLDNAVIPEILSLVEKGADVNCLGEYGRTPLMFHHVYGEGISTAVLIAFGADVNIAEEDDSMTAFLHAAYDGSAEIMNVLLAAGADPNARDHYECNALLLYHLGGDWRKSALIRHTLVTYCDIHAYNNEGNTTLMYALKEKDFKMMKLLVERGVNINAANLAGKTALDIATDELWDERAEFLRKLGAS
ncbi:ankyrin repeat domain-containing protein [bacterium]|nr:ankyrin repeat domain-containing protein [bacterium]